ncbi:MAG: GatB/YqeY domain-containing protein [Candidatus Yanofskybacteria bacterium]|nr:GatB/YqeY domain-containing protein [Candidatus Yanofskybacteria bacterium]
MLKEKIQQDMKEAMKSGDANKRLVLSMLVSATKNKELQKRAKSGKEEVLNDDEVMDVIASEIKKRKESIEIYEKVGREELAQKERDELNVLMEYIPEQMEVGDVRLEVRKTIDELGAKDIKDTGKVIGAVISKLKGRADGQTVSRIVKEELST